MTTRKTIEEDFKRWKEAFEGHSTNSTIMSQENPTTEEGFLRLMIIDEKTVVKDFVVTHAVKEVVSRKRKYVEWFTTGPDGKKLGVSLQWKRREEVWRNTSDEEIDAINKEVDRLVAQGGGGTLDAERLRQELRENHKSI
jgi:hypothetical protein